MKRVLIIIAILHIVLIVNLYFKPKEPVFVGDTQHNKIIKSVTSQNGEKVAVAFNRDFGATTDNNIQVSILRDNDFKDEPGNVFIGNHSETVDIKWKNNNTLVVSHNCDEGDVCFKKDKIKDINIVYEKLNK